mmetsp:Transcript_32922/g.86977  ORF Transcript_32922/g.86977 Transcript_32922/m.86977 type:complete len:576 (+) Transcript_32922:30-1757(+)
MHGWPRRAAASEEEVLPGERQRRGRVARQPLPIGRDLEGLRVHLDVRARVVVDHVLLGDRARAPDGLHRLLEAVLAADVKSGGCLGHEGHAGRSDGLAEGAEHGAHDHRLGRRDGGVRVAHLRPGDGAPLNDHLGLGAEHGRGPDDKVRHLANLHAADYVGHAVGERRVDGVLGNVPLDAGVVVALPGVLRQRPALKLHLCRGLPRARDHLADATHGLGVRGDDGDGAHVVQDVLRRDRLAPDARLREGHVLRDVLVQVVAHHQHVQVLVDGVDRERPRGIRGRRDDVGEAADLDDVGGVAAAGALRVVGVDGAALHRRNGVVDEAGLVDGVRVDGDGQVVQVCVGERAVDHRGRGAPVLVQLQARSPGVDDVLEAGRVRRVPLAGEAEVQRVRVRGLQHHRDLARRGSAGGGVGAGGGPGPAAVHGGESRGDGIIDLLRADEVHVHVATAGSHDHLLGSDRLGVHADDHPRRHALHAIGVARLADANNPVALDADVRLDDAQLRVDDQGVGHHDVQRPGGVDAGGLAHALAQHLAAAELALVAVHRQVPLHLRDQARVSEGHLVTHGGAEEVRI